MKMWAPRWSYLDSNCDTSDTTNQRAYVERCQTIHPARSVDISHVHDNVDVDEDDVLNRRHV